MLLLFVGYPFSQGATVLNLLSGYKVSSQWSVTPILQIQMSGPENTRL